MCKLSCFFFRLYPTIPMNVRMLDTDIDLNGHLVPKNVSKSHTLK